MHQFIVNSLRPENLLFYLFAYALAATPTSYLVARIIHKIDILKIPHYSHTSASIWRNISKRSGFLVFVLDLLKGLLPCAIAQSLNTPPEVIALIGLVAVIGHCFSIWLNFSGGKGSATATGAVLIVFWPAAVLALATFVFLLLLKIRSGHTTIFASIVGLSVLFLGMHNNIVLLIVAIMVAIIFIRHKKLFSGNVF